ncbi:group IIE secretory phospholipase A2-like [Python bivittatus]|uniref:Group IIE secretory phospholipase A2-like n=1 Tax=Python bivittatus TaxID=176946 RepID=A0A9F5IFZ6_PYTBI|nr:group IIE secretory phospholipase A2-like [Python bivittatus]
MAIRAGIAKISTLLSVLVFASANLIQFGKIIQHLTGRPPLIYNGYGCYCGLGGSKQPMDATDWCCRAHDCCYQAVKQRHCKPKTEKYSYSVEKSTVVCGGKTDCQRQTCECDKAAALCFRSAPFHRRLVSYPNVLCRGRTPPCQDLHQSCTPPSAS